MADYTDPDLSDPAVRQAIIEDATRVTRAEQAVRRKRATGPTDRWLMIGVWVCCLLGMLTAALIGVFSR